MVLRITITNETLSILTLRITIKNGTLIMPLRKTMTNATLIYGWEETNPSDIPEHPYLTSISTPSE